MSNIYARTHKLAKFVFSKLTGGLEVIGIDNVPKDCGLIITANHCSYADPPILGTASPRQVSFMAKSDLFKVPGLKQIMLKLGAFPVKRGAFDRHAIDVAKEILTSGKVMTLFFEGGRSKDGKLMKPALGMATIAVKTNVPIVPAAIIGSDKLMPHRGGFHRSKVKVVFGKPIYLEEFKGKFSGRELVQKISNTVAITVANLLKENGAEYMVPENYLIDSNE